MELEEVDMDEVNGMLGVTGGGGVASNAKDTSPSTPEDDAEPIKGAKKAVTKKTKADVAGKKAGAEKKQSAAASLRRRSASFEELQAVDWDKMTKSTPVKYDPNRLIFGATEDGFMELEEVDMDEVNADGRRRGRRLPEKAAANDRTFTARRTTTPTTPTPPPRVTTHRTASRCPRKTHASPSARHDGRPRWRLPSSARRRHAPRRQTPG
jgi:hypothetical protein